MAESAETGAWSTYLDEIEKTIKQVEVAKKAPAQKKVSRKKAAKRKPATKKRPTKRPTKKG